MTNSTVKWDEQNYGEVSISTTNLAKTIIPFSYKEMSTAIALFHFSINTWIKNNRG